MDYTYTGTANTELLESYRTDEESFQTCKSPGFPERQGVIKEVDSLRRLLFPACWNADELVGDKEAILAEINELGELFCKGIQPYSPSCMAGTVTKVLNALPEIRELLKKDVIAAYKGDPAAKSYIEIIRAYPGLQAMMVHRVAHRLYTDGQPVYARELTEAAKSTTGIDIHPGAEIGEYFFIDHGSGVVIGETATIGNWVRLYQEVTLGALHFEEQEDDERALKKDYKRHPDIGNNVVIGAGSKVLGPISIGDHVSIEANSWVTEDVPDHTKVFTNHPELERKSFDD